jgi:hypothetical protein
MGGHEDGILFFSENMAQTGQKVVQIMEKSWAIKAFPLVDSALMWHIKELCLYIRGEFKDGKYSTTGRSLWSDTRGT